MIVFESTSGDGSSRFRRRISALFNTLEEGYLKAKPDFGPNGFKQRVLLRLKAHFLKNSNEIIQDGEKIDVDRLVNLVLDFESIPLPLDLFCIYAAAIYGIKAEQLGELGPTHAELSWDALADASFWLGWAASTSKGKELLDTVYAKGAIAENAIHAARVRHEEVAIYKQWAHNYVRNSKNLRSLNRASEVIRDALLQEFGLKARRSKETVRDWLKEMSDLKTWFPNTK